MVKIYVLDTNILIQAPYAIDHFEDNSVVLPMVVLEELDHLKKAEGERGANARSGTRSKCPPEHQPFGTAQAERRHAQRRGG